MVVVRDLISPIIRSLVVVGVVGLLKRPIGSHYIDISQQDFGSVWGEQRFKEIQSDFQSLLVLFAYPCLT